LKAVEISISPPVYYQMTDKRAGVYSISQEILPGEGLVDLISRLASSSPKAWDGVYDVRKGRFHGTVLVALNDILIPNIDDDKSVLSNGDRISIYNMYVGG